MTTFVKSVDTVGLLQRAPHSLNWHRNRWERIVKETRHRPNNAINVYVSVDRHTRIRLSF